MSVLKSWKALRQDGVYKDITPCGPFLSHHNIANVRKDIMRNIPPSSSLTEYGPRIDSIFLPFTFNGEPFFSFGVENACLNHKYEPFTILFYAMRDHYRDMYDYCSGVVIATEKDYEDIRTDFNRGFTKVLDGCSSSAEGRGLCSVEEMIRLGSQFYLLQRSCCNIEGLVTDADRRFENKWNGRRTIISTTFREFEQYAFKLKKTYMSGLNWFNFFHRYADKTNDETLWLFNLPKVERYKGEEFEQEFTEPELFSLFDCLVSITKREGFAFVLGKRDEEVLDLIKNHFTFRNIAGKKSGAFLYLNDDLGETGEYFCITNYETETSIFKRSEVA
jgi:hypothetical protein